MVIMLSKFGQLGNRLFTFGHFIANSIENNYPLLNPNFDKYSKFFETISKDDFYEYPITINPAKHKISTQLVDILNYKPVFYPLHWLNKALPLNVKFVVDKDRDFEMNRPEFIELAKNKTVYAYGWLFRDKRNFNKHADTIRKIFAPLQIHQDSIKELMRGCRSTCDILVGVHMRKGDYATYANGKYYYDTSVYAEKMNTLKEIFEQKNQKVSFLLCSNEPFSTEDFPGLDVVQSTNHFIEDMYALAECDYIIGPPSSYSTWASFYGKAPLCILRSKEQKILLSDFKVYIYYDYL